MLVKLIKNVCILALFLLITQISTAQMIDYQRRHKKYPIKPETTEAENPKTETQTSKVENIPVSNRFEEAYDQNQDNLLQVDEIEMLLKDVVSSVEKWGQSVLSSPILKEFDKDGNDLIDVMEAGEIKSRLE